MLKLPAQILILNDEKHNTMHRYENTLLNFLLVRRLTFAFDKSNLFSAL